MKEDTEDTEARSENSSREDVARIATFNIKILVKQKWAKHVIELVNIILRYDMFAVQDIKDLIKPFLTTS